MKYNFTFTRILLMQIRKKPANRDLCESKVGINADIACSHKNLTGNLQMETNSPRNRRSILAIWNQKKNFLVT